MPNDDTIVPGPVKWHDDLAKRAYDDHQAHIERLEREYRIRIEPHVQAQAALFEKYATQTYLQFPKAAIAPNGDIVPLNALLTREQDK